MTRETKSYELKIYDQSLMRFEAAYDAFGSLKLEITDIDSANAHLLPLNLIVDQDEKSLASWMEGRTIPKNRAFVEQILSTAGLTRNDILGILDVSKGLSINDSYWLDDGKSDVTFDKINLFDNRFDEVLGLVAYTGYTPSQKHKAGVSSEWTLGGQTEEVQGDYIVIPLCYTNIYGMAQPNELQTSSHALSAPQRGILDGYESHF